MTMTACKNRTTFSKGETDVKTSLSKEFVSDSDLVLTKLSSNSAALFSLQKSTAASSCKYLPMGSYPNT